MRKLDKVIVGFNHMFLYPDSMINADVHTKSLQRLASNPNVDALDCWVRASKSKDELQILKNCGKQINYNIGDRCGEKPVFPATRDKKEREYALEILRRETGFAVEAGAKKIIFGSGKDIPEDREDAKKRFEEFVLLWSEFIPKDIWITLEPTDRDVDKCFLYGNMRETYDAVRSIRKAGMDNMGILLDMGHIPIMHETLESAAVIGGDLLEHIHLGNCIIKNIDSPYYGDKHPCWGCADGEYDEHDGEKFLKQLVNCGYFTRGNDRTISFEMRPLKGMHSEDTVEYLGKWINEVYKKLGYSN